MEWFIAFAMIVWLVIGFLIAVAAGLTHDFEKRFFPYYILIPFGPLAILVWKYVENREGEGK